MQKEICLTCLIGKMFPKEVKAKKKYIGTCQVLLTLIQMAGGVYDSRNFEQVKLHIVLSNKNFKN
jgi:hypothetical protein